MLRAFSKLLPVFFTVLVLLGTASALITVSEPLADVKLSNNDEAQLGSVAVGETFTVVIQKKSGRGFDWDSLKVSVPNGWKADYRFSDKTIIADITVPGFAPESTQVLNFAVSSSQNSGLGESFSGILVVRKNLLTIAMDNLKQKTFVGETINYKFIASNDSIADHGLVIMSSLPNYWFEPVEVTLKAKQKQELTLSLTPQAYGLRNFSFFVKSGQNDFSKEFFAELTVEPTLRGKFMASAYALPFFSLSNFPFYLVNSLLSMGLPQ